MHSNNAFDLIRFMAALGVLFSHSFPTTGQPEPTYYGGETLGSLSVFVFFAVSGFLVQRSWDRNRSAFVFALSRALRIFPGLVMCVFLCAFVLGPMLSTSSPTSYFSDSSPYKFVYSNLAMLFIPRSNNIVGVFTELPFPNAVNSSLWTIRYEVFMYITLLAVVWLFAKSSKAIAAVLLCSVGVWVVGKNLGLDEPGDLLWRLSYIGLDGRILKLAPFFWVGALLARVPIKAINPVIALVGMVVLFLASRSAVAILALWLLLPYCVLAVAYHAPKLFNGFGKHGDFSYGLYLYAFPVQQTLSFYLITSWPVHFTASIAIALTIAIVSWKLVESPALSLKNKLRFKTNVSQQKSA